MASLYVFFKRECIGEEAKGTYTGSFQYKKKQKDFLFSLNTDEKSCLAVFCWRLFED